MKFYLGRFWRLTTRSVDIIGQYGMLSWIERVAAYMNRKLSERFPGYAYSCFTAKAQLSKDELESLKNYWLENGRQHRSVFISLIITVNKSQYKYLRGMVGSIKNQIYPHWELLLFMNDELNDSRQKEVEKLPDGDERIQVISSNSEPDSYGLYSKAFSMTKGDYVGFLRVDASLAEEALDHVARWVEKHNDVDVIYSDEDYIDAKGKQYNPVFYPDYSPALFLQMINNIGTFFYSRCVVEKTGGFRKDYKGAELLDFAMRACEQAREVAHIPRVLYHRMKRRSADIRLSDDRILSEKKAVISAMERRGVQGKVEFNGDGYHISRTLSMNPKVSIVIPMRDKPELLKCLMDSMDKYRTYRNIEIVIVDNGSMEQRTTDLLDSLIKKRPDLKVVREECEFNYPRLVRAGVENSNGEYILQLNNDIEVIHDDWLEPLIAHALEPDVGAVGALLVYPDGRVQHAGVGIGIGGVAGHMHRGISSAKQNGINHRYAMMFDREVSAVTGACMLMRRSIYDEVGGMDEKNLKIAFNDLDLCLRLRKSGYRIIHTPACRLIHHESLSRGREIINPNEIEYFREQWKPSLYYDPYFNPNLSRRNEYGSVCHNPWKMSV